MKNVCCKFLYFLAVAFYGISVLEVNDFGIQNTFFDEYDTYVESSQQDIPTVVSQENDKDENHAGSRSFFDSRFQTLKFQKQIPVSTNGLYTRSVSGDQGRKIFMFHSVWII